MTPEEFNSKHRKNLCFDLFRAGLTLASCVTVYVWSYLLGMFLDNTALGPVIGLSLSSLIFLGGVCALTGLKATDSTSWFVGVFLVLYHQIFGE